MATGTRGETTSTLVSSTAFEDRLRWGLLAVWVVLLCALAFAERPAAYGDLESALRNGDVHSVRVGPVPLPERATGFGSQEVHWRTGLHRYRSEVTMVAGPRDGSALTDGVTLRRGRDAATQLRTLAPGLEIARVAPADGDGQIFGWYVPGWLGIAGLVLVLATLAQLVVGPRPWRATRWAWFWLMATPVGVLAFLALSGPTPGVPRPRTPHPALRGGLAFVIAALSTTVLPDWWQQF